MEVVRGAADTRVAVTKTVQMDGKNVVLTIVEVAGMPIDRSETHLHDDGTGELYIAPRRTPC